ncbi:MAG: hypothetical protein OER21_13740 [Gemmatimonadota bacterium]|nr:hypothetical protein [Gemmatimonadota bacterium]
MRRFFGRLLRWLFFLLVIGGLAAAASYAGARATAGKLLGQKPPVSERRTRFAYRGVSELPGNPRAWIITYGRTSLPGVRTVTIYVSPTGALLASRPNNLAERLEAYEQSREP